MKMRTCVSLLLAALLVASCEHFDEPAGSARVSRIQRPGAAKKPDPYPFSNQKQPAVSTSPAPTTSVPVPEPLPQPEETAARVQPPAPKPAPAVKDEAPYPFASQKQPLVADKPLPEAAPAAPAPAVTTPAPEVKKPEPKKPEPRPVVSQQQPSYSGAAQRSSGRARLPIAPPTAGRQKKYNYPLMPGQNRGLKARMY